MIQITGSLSRAFIVPRRPRAVFCRHCQFGPAHPVCCHRSHSKPHSSIGLAAWRGRRSRVPLCGSRLRSSVVCRLRATHPRRSSQPPNTYAAPVGIRRCDSWPANSATWEGVTRLPSRARQSCPCSLLFSEDGNHKPQPSPVTKKLHRWAWRPIESLTGMIMAGGHYNHFVTEFRNCLVETGIPPFSPPRQKMTLDGTVPLLQRSTGLRSVYYTNSP